MPNIEPFVRWAGGKTWLIPYMSELIRNIQIEHYHEPFLGGGAVFFSTEHAKKSYLSDANPQLINTYLQVRDNPEDVIHFLENMPNTESDYYQIRDEFTLDNTPSIPVVAFVDLNRQEQIKLFMDINENQKAVSKTLRVTLNADMLWDSPEFAERRQALRSKIAQMLGEEETSPLLGRVVIGEDEKSSTKCISVGVIQAALKSSNFITQFGKKNTIVKDGTFDVGSNQETCDLLYPFLESCLRYVKDAVPNEWERGDSNDGMLTMNRGIQALIRVINDIVNHLIERKEISPKTQNTDEVVRQVAFYLDPLNQYLNDLTQQ